MSRNLLGRTHHAKRCENQRTLYIGHSHARDMHIPHCALAHLSSAHILSPPHAKYNHLGTPLVPVQRQVQQFFSPFLDKKEIRLWMQASGAFRSRGFSTVVVGSWAWGLIWENSHPDEVQNQVSSGLKQILAAQRAAPAGRWPLKLIIMLPHYHRKPSHANRVLCQTEARIRIYSKAVEAAAYEFRLKVED